MPAVFQNWPIPTLIKVDSDKSLHQRSFCHGFKSIERVPVQLCFLLSYMVAYFCREIWDSYRDNFRKLSRKFEVFGKFNPDSKKFSRKYITMKFVI